ncbi:MAG: TOBE domain-containing protein [Symbiopectobacterium sp.]
MRDFHANHPLGFPIGSQCDWLVRPQEIVLALDPDGAALIEDRVFLGTSNMYLIRLAERVLMVQSSNWFEPGQQVRISIRPDQPIFSPRCSLIPSLKRMRLEWLFVGFAHLRRWC